MATERPGDGDQQLPPISRNIKLLREKLGWTQVELAERAGISSFSVSRYEQGGTPAFGPAQQLAAAFGLRVDDLLSATEPALPAELQRLAGVRLKLEGPVPPGLREKLLEVMRTYTPEQAEQRQAEKDKDPHPAPAPRPRSRGPIQQQPRPTVPPPHKRKKH